VRGKFLHKVYKLLASEEQTELHLRLYGLPDGVELVRVCTLLAEMEAYSDRELLRRLRLHKEIKDRYLDLLWHALLTLLAGDGKLVVLAKAIGLAKRLLFASAYDAAKEMIEAGLVLAAEAEAYEMVLRIWDLVDCYHEVPTIHGMSAREATEHLADQSFFRSLDLELKQARLAPTAHERITALEDILQRALARAAVRSFCPSATYLYYKLMAMGHVLMFEHSKAVPVLEALIVHIQAEPQVCLDAEFAVAKELRTLSRVLWRSKEMEKFAACNAILEGLPLEDLHSLYSQIFYRFPFMIGVALDTGDVPLGNAVCKELMAIASRKDLDLTLEFLSECYFWSAYFYLVSGNGDALLPVFGRLNRVPQGKFKPQYYLLSKLLGVIYAIEVGEWGQASNFHKGLRSAKSLSHLPGLLTMLDYLAILIKRKRINGPFDEATTANLQQLEGELVGLEVLQYFDFLAWLKAKAQGRPTIELIGRRAE
jgi:hypothetical protein